MAKEMRNYRDFISECEGETVKIVNVLISFYMNHNCNNAASSTDAQFFSNLIQPPSNLAVQFTETIF